jgi:hypothetical protein
VKFELFTNTTSKEIPLLRVVVWFVGQVPANPRPPLSQLLSRSVTTSPLFPEPGEHQLRGFGMGEGLDRALGFMDGVNGVGVDILTGDGGYSEIVQCAKEIFPFLGISCGGNEKKLLDLLIVLDKEHR